ncbi:unnamed protein product [Peronospora farinosa]|uniref:Uncharacterized protein n=1 Tax=Peronospora farinosa TaxID=134698 RepID=A0AAV0TRB2_9STRA|nr:unnamed protein product [Peronospora farinosa]
MLESELHALKTELQSTLMDLNIVCMSSEDDDTDCLDISSATVITETQKSWRRPHSTPHFCNRNQPITRWNRRQLMQELSLVSKRRQHLEKQLKKEFEREQQVQGQKQDRDQRRTSRRRACQSAILQLQQQRAHILQQIEHEMAADASEIPERQDSRQTHDQETSRNNWNQMLPTSQATITRPVKVLCNSETQYSIGGIVTLEPLSSSQQPQVSTMRTGVSLHPAVDVASIATEIRNTQPRQLYRHTPDTLNDVFVLQLKFAETMLKLEKSVQIRDQLLQHDRMSSLANSKTKTQVIEETRHTHRPSRHRRRSIQCEANSDLSVIYQENSDKSFSSSAYSSSSLDTTPHRGQNIRMEYPNFEVSRATTAETHAPSALGGENSLNMEGIDRMSMVSARITTQSPHESSEDNRNSVAEHTPSNEQESEVNRTPTTDSSAPTPTTGSDQKSTSSLSKQVRFGDDAYSTPVLARKFNFDGPSIDEDEYEEKDEEAGSVLSFLGGSSVTSMELNDVSFLRAFERFRHELNASRLHSVTQSSLQLPLARKLFPEQNVLQTVKTANSAPRVLEGVQENTVASTGEADACDHITVFPALDGLSIEELQVLRGRLCLDIQAASAQLVLSFGKAQNVNAGSQDTEQIQHRLQMMRDELKAVDVRLKLLE